MNTNTKTILIVCGVVNLIALYLISFIQEINYQVAFNSFSFKISNWMYVFALLMFVGIFISKKSYRSGFILVLICTLSMIIVSPIGINDAIKIDKQNNHYEDIYNAIQNVFIGVPQSTASNSSLDFKETSIKIKQIEAGYVILALSNSVAIVTLLYSRKQINKSNTKK